MNNPKVAATVYTLIFFLILGGIFLAIVSAPMQVVGPVLVVVAVSIVVWMVWDIFYTALKPKGRGER